MRVLVVGGGGREHALVWKIGQSPIVKKIFCAPGNAGIASQAELVNINAENISGLADFAEGKSIDLTVVGPEAPLVAGIVNEFERRGLSIFGPSEEAARLEGSKVFAKEFMERFSIPTGKYRVFSEREKAVSYLQDIEPPVVIKAEGLAAGKGVTVAMSCDEAIEAVDRILRHKIFGEAGKRIIIEEYLEGEEATLLAFCDGETVALMVSSQDHKRIFDGDQGSNTGGMGAYSPAPVVTPLVMEKIYRHIFLPTVQGMWTLGFPYRGVLYGGLMICQGEPYVLEYNVRFGDPETQAVLPLLKTDLIEIIHACLEGRLFQLPINWDDGVAVCVVLASGGYPGAYETGKVISGVEEAEKLPEVVIFHAGTARRDDGTLVTSGGRVLGVTGRGGDHAGAMERAYQAAGKIHFAGMHYRKDIGRRALARIFLDK